jgi:hypothetical protein
MRTPFFLGSAAFFALAAGLGLGALASSCDSTLPSATGGAGGTGGGAGGGPLDCSNGGPLAAPLGEVCNDATQDPSQIHVMVSPQRIFLPRCAPGAACTTRTVKVVVDPDTCWTSPVTFEVPTDQQKMVETPAATKVSLHHDQADVVVTAGAVAGTATITVKASIEPDPCRKEAAKKAGLPIPQAVEVTTPLTVEVLDAAPPPCTGPAATGTVHADEVPLAMAGTPGATIHLPKGADTPPYNSFLWSVPPFDATVSCAADLAMPGHTALGPAITFGPDTTLFPRDVPLSIPVNPGLFPSAARLRHLVVAYSGPSFKKPRGVAVSDAHFQQVGGQWALTFMAPRLGTYQAFVPVDAGLKKYNRNLSYRGVTGVSMGGGGSATFGLRHHNLFDVIAPLGGPVDWTWMLNYIENNHLGGFRPIPSGTTLKDIQLASTDCTTQADCKSDEKCVGPMGQPPGKCRLMPAAKEPYLHPQTFNTWWYEYPRAGNGGTFARDDYSQIFRDLALMYGNPNGDNLAPDGENLPAGVPPTDQSVVGDHPGRECAVWVDPLDCANGMDTCPEKEKQQEIHNNCPAERCAHTLTLSNYFDDEYNPDGIFPVITVCDGSPQDQAATPYSNTWSSGGNGYPLEVGLAVDYNGNGVRDEMEPIIRAGHEPWTDTGADGLLSSQEPGYVAGVNEDPSGDDYDAQYNPTGTEGDHRYQPGEPYLDYGLDGVANTKQQPAGGYQHPGDGYDVGEGDGKFTVSRGLQRFWDGDAHSIVRRMVDPAKVPGGDLSDDALSRVDFWTDGGLRDLFNFGVDAQHLVGAFAARGRSATYLTGFGQAPGLDPTNPNSYDGKLVSWDDLPGVVFQRYGHIDPSPTDIDNGSGQHVGTGLEVTSRLEAAFYYIASRWRHRTDLTLRVEDTDDSNAVPGCSEKSVTLQFPAADQPTGPSGRRGPAGVSFPPGYCNKNLQQIRYPVVYLLHGYGQGPEDLEATIILLRNFMNDPRISASRRLPKAIIVYVDGRCRTNPDGSAECIRGTFFTDSVRKGGAQDETWWLELMNHVDKTYRTLPGEAVEWTE